MATALAALTLGSVAVVPAAVAASAADTRGTVVPPVAPAVQAAPTDLIRGREWHLGALHAERAWKWGRGKGVTVAVLDTGVDGTHPDLTGRVITGPDLTGGARRPGSPYWGRHGTAMASIIAGHGHGAGLQSGVLGLAPQARILSIRVTWENDDPIRRSGIRRNGSQVDGNRDAVAQGIRYAVDHGADIINMSLGGGKQFYDGNPTEEAAIRYALAKGVVLIASAGNDGASANRKNFPAAYPGVIAVGALDRQGRVWKDTNRRGYVSVCAPGVEIVSADAGSGYVVGTGTSPSSAIVAGVAALVRARYPRLTPAEVSQALTEGGTPGTTGTARVCRARLDAARAITAAARISKQERGPASTLRTPTAPAPQPAAAPVSGNTNDMLLVGVLVGGGALVLIGLVLGWRQRRDAEEAAAEADEIGFDDAEAAPGRPRSTPSRVERPSPEPLLVPGGAHATEPPAAVAAARPTVDTAMAPVSVPPWQSTDVLPAPPAPSPIAPADPAQQPPAGPPEHLEGTRPGSANGNGNGTGAGSSPGLGSGAVSGIGGHGNGVPPTWPPPPAPVAPVLEPYESAPAGPPLTESGPSDGAGEGERPQDDGGTLPGEFSWSDPDGAPDEEAAAPSAESVADLPWGPGGDSPGSEPGDLGFGDDPLGGGPVAPISDTPLADQSWQSVRRRTESGDGPANGSAPVRPSAADVYSDVGPVNDEILNEDRSHRRAPRPTRPVDDEDFRPPWW